MAIDKVLLRKQRDHFQRLAESDPNPMQRLKYAGQVRHLNIQLGIDETRPDDPIVIRQKRALEIAREKRERKGAYGKSSY